LKSSVFVSVVISVHDRANKISNEILSVSNAIKDLVEDYEIIIVDNGSQDSTFKVLSSLTRDNGLANLQVFSLLENVNSDAALWAGIENSIGDLVLTLDPEVHDIDLLESMLALFEDGKEIVFASAKREKHFFNYIYNFWSRLIIAFTGVDIKKDNSTFRVMSRSVVNYISKCPQPVQFFRYLVYKSGFSIGRLSYNKLKSKKTGSSLFDRLDKGLRLMTFSSKKSMRVVNMVSLLAAFANVIYSFYVLGIVFFKENVAEGWATLSLQQSGMFFVISMVLFFIGEYLLAALNSLNALPDFNIVREATSDIIKHKQTLNVDSFGDERAISGVNDTDSLSNYL
jgi:polyisoprenyl-phosphate glycosyltransferase